MGRYIDAMIDLAKVFSFGIRLNTPQWFWGTSRASILFNGPFGTRELALKDAKGHQIASVYVGKSTPVEIEVDANDLIERWQDFGHDQLYQDALDFWCHNPGPKELKCLSDELTKVFKKHLKKWGEPTVWHVINEPRLWTKKDLKNL